MKKSRQSTVNKGFQEVLLRGESSSNEGTFDLPLAGFEQMVPQHGKASNHFNVSSTSSTSQTQAALAICNDDCKNKVEPSFTPDIEALFDTLTRWNEYLENHVPYYRNRALGGPRP